MTHSSGEMGMRKHGRCGSRNGNGKSPKLRMHMKREAAKNDRVSKPSTCTSTTVKDLFK